MPQSTPARQRGPNGRFISFENALSAIPPPRARDFFSLPIEIRCTVYKALFNGTPKYTLRRQADAKAREAPYMTLFDNAIICTCKTICAEALPIFYSTQKFHYSAGTEIEAFGLDPPFMLEHTKWIEHLSIEVTVNSQTSKKLDSLVTTHVLTIAQHFARLARFTLHVIPAVETGKHRIPNDLSQAQASNVFDQGEAAKALKWLRFKVDLLRIVMYGNWHDLHPFRSAIAGDEQWVEGDKCWDWPGVRLTEAQYAAVSIRQRRYSLAGIDNGIHPHKCCIRVFDLYKSRMKRLSTKKEN